LYQDYGRADLLEPDFVGTVGFFVKLWPEHVEKPVNTALGAITQPWIEWAKANIPDELITKVSSDIEQLATHAFKLLLDTATSLDEDNA
jgi:hypothetical protein